MKHIFLSIALCSLAVFHTAQSADDIVFPAGAGVFDITKPPYSANNTGAVDVTQKFRDALRDIHEQRKPTYMSVMPILYIPAGTYLVSDTISWVADNTYNPQSLGPHMIGQSRERTIIKLKDTTARFADSTKPRWLISTGDGVAQFFNRGIQNLTINTGTGNHGVIALNYFGNNQSIASDLNILSPDGSGYAGMDISRSEEGPALGTKIYIHGYKYGIWSHPLNSVTLSRIRIVGSRFYGIYNQGSPLYIDSLFTDSCGRKLVGTIIATSGCAVANQGGGTMVITDATMLNGLLPGVAIRNEGSSIFIRNIRSTGYARAFMSSNYPAGKTPPTSTAIAEYVNGKDTGLFTPTSPISMNLPVKYPPEVAWETDMTKWALPTTRAALQTAIDDPSKTHICIPKWTKMVLDQDVTIRGNIRRIILAGAQISGGTNNYKLIIADGASTAPVLKIEKLSAGTNNYMPIYIRTKRQVILESSTPGSPITCDGAAAGELYFLDLPVPIICTNPNQKIWAWQYNAEGSDGYMLDMSAGTARIFGWKDEGTGQSVRMTGGIAEVLGLLNYAGSSDKSTTPPQITIAGTAQFSIAMATQLCWSAPTDSGWYHVLVTETRNGVSRTLRSENNPAGYSLPLYCAFTPSAAQNPAPHAPSHSFKLVSTAVFNNTISISYTLDKSGTTEIFLYAAQGKLINIAVFKNQHAGNQIAELALPNRYASGMYQVVVNHNGINKAQTVCFMP